MGTLGQSGVVGGAAAPQQEGLPPLCTALHPLRGLSLLPYSCKCWCPFPPFSSPAFEERLPRGSKLGPRLERAPDGSLRRHDLWRRCGRLSSEGAGGAEGGAERAERWHQPHHPGKQRLDHHTQQPQPQCISDPPLPPCLPRLISPASPSSSILTALFHSPLWGRSHLLETFTYCKGLLYLS